jgi:hypothetical protein
MSVMLLIIFEFHENLNEGHTHRPKLNLICACTVKLYVILKIQDALVKSV